MFEVAQGHVFEFGEFRLDTTRRLLTRNGEPVQLSYKAFEMLALLVANSGRIVEKDEILREIWPDTFVEEGSLARNISVLRKVLGETPGEHQYIQTIPKQGYRFVAPLREVFEPLDPVSGKPNVEFPAEMGEGDVQSPPVVSANRNFLPFLTLAGLFFAIAVTAVGFYIFTRRSEPSPGSMEITRFTVTGNALDAAISPDGKYVVYVENENSKQSLWVKQVASGSLVQIVAPADVNFQGLAFSTDANYVFYNVWDKVHVGAIFRIPVLGGESVKVVNDVMPTIAVSPDNSEIAFVRSVAATGQTFLIISNVGGSGERVVAQRSRENPGWFSSPMWSPDGSSIAYAAGGVGEQGQSFMQVAEVPSKGGRERFISGLKFMSIGGLVWLGDGKNLIITASEQPQTPNQLWRVNESTGDAKRISNDVTGYNGISITSDGKSLVAAQGDIQSNIFVGAEGRSAEWKKITSGRYEGLNLAWSPDGRIVYVSQESGNNDIWIMNADGTGRKRLTTDPAVDASPTVTADGKYVVFASLRNGVPHIFRMDIDGGDPLQLTNGPGEWNPTASPADSVVIFHSSSDRGMWKMHTDGSGQVRLNEKYTYTPSVSFDGTRVAFSFWDDDAKPEQLRQAIYDLVNERQTILPSVPKTAVRQDSNVILKWSPDGKSYAYVDDRDGVSNIWRQPIAGGPPEQITNFNDSFIFSFDWASDGRIAAARGSFAFDVVLIRNFE